MKPMIFAVTVFAILLMTASMVSGNNAIAKKYQPGELPNGASKDDVKKKSLDEIRALAEQAKKDALEKLQKDNPAKQSKTQNDAKQAAMDKAKAEMKKRTDAALAALKTKTK